MTITLSFLGMCLASNDIILKTKLSEDDFPEEGEAFIFTSMKEIMLDGGEVDLISLKHKNVDLRILMTLDSQLSSSWRAREKQIIEATRKRNIIKVAHMVLESSSLPAKDLEDMVAHEMAKLDKRGDYEPCLISTVANEEMERILYRGTNKQRLIGITSGIKLIDYMTLGFQKRKLYFIGGRPSQGKTSLLVNFALNCNKRFGFLSAESGKEEIAIKMFASVGRIDSRKLALGSNSNGDFTIMSNFVEREKNMKSVIYDKPNMDIEELTFMARNFVENYGCEILLVDYIQIISPSFDMRKREKREQVADVSLRLKQLCRDLNVPIIVAAQLTRESDKERPQLSSFSDSSQIEKDADVAILIWNKKEEVVENKVKSTTEKTYLLIDKNRDGEKGDIEVYFKKDSQTFEMLESDNRY